MGVSIDLQVYTVSSLLDEIEKHVEESGGRREGALPPREWFTKVAEHFGVVDCGKFYVVWNDYYEDYNPANNFLQCVDDYYFPGHEEMDNTGNGYWNGFFPSCYRTESEGANSLEVLGDVFPEEFGYEGKFMQ